MVKRTKKGRNLTEYLAAPENVIKNERERAKLQERKAREAARQAQILAGKRKTPPTVEDMLADIVRVAEDPDSNPIGHTTRSISRARYEQFGHFPVLFVDRQFGQWNHALGAAGLRDKVGTQLWRRNRAKESRREHAQRYFERHVLPYVAHQEDYRRLHKPYLLLSISDLHAQWLCPFVFSAFLQAIRDLRPNGVLVNGDWIDGSEISRHQKIPGWTVPLVDELSFARAMFRRIRQAMGDDGDLFVVDGNHDPTTRLANYLAHVAPAIANMPELRVDNLLGLGDAGVRIMQGGSILSPKGQEDAKPGFLLWDFYRIHHGTRLGSDPARLELRDAGRSGQSGHVHRASLAFGTTERDEGLSWMCTPMASRHEVGRSYMHGTTTGWQRGFGVAWLYPDGTVHQYPVVVSGSPERITVEGHVYTRAKGADDPEPRGNWLELVA
jgi:hypothetical protein